MGRLKIPIILGTLLVFVLLGLTIFPVLWNERLAKKWEQQIRKNQNPEELQNWAKEMFLLYATNGVEWLEITNTPPKGIPVSSYGPKILLEKDGEGNNNPPHLFLIWRFVRARGLYIGETNYIRNDCQMWKPGIYFYTEP